MTALREMQPGDLGTVRDAACPSWRHPPSPSWSNEPKGLQRYGENRFTHIGGELTFAEAPSLR
jgi:hypothetical protein